MTAHYDSEKDDRRECKLLKAPLLPLAVPLASSPVKSGGEAVRRSLPSKSAASITRVVRKLGSALWC